MLRIRFDRGRTGRFMTRSFMLTEEDHRALFKVDSVPTDVLLLQVLNCYQQHDVSRSYLFEYFAYLRDEMPETFDHHYAFLQECFEAFARSSILVAPFCTRETDRFMIDRGILKRRMDRLKDLNTPMFEEHDVALQILARSYEAYEAEVTSVPPTQRSLSRPKHNSVSKRARVA